MTESWFFLKSTVTLGDPMFFENPIIREYRCKGQGVPWFMLYSSTVHLAHHGQLQLPCHCEKPETCTFFVSLHLQTRVPWIVDVCLFMRHLNDMLYLLFSWSTPRIAYYFLKSSGMKPKILWSILQASAPLTPSVMVIPSTCDLIWDGSLLRYTYDVVLLVWKAGWGICHRKCGNPLFCWNYLSTG